MKRLLYFMAVSGAVLAAYGAQETLTDQDATKVGLQSAIPKINSNFDELYAGSIDLASGKILVGNSGGTGAAVTVSGDIAIDNTGAATIQAHSVEVTMLPAMTTGQILVGDSSDSNANVVAASGVTFDVAGAASVDASALTAGTVASAIDISAATNLPTSGLAVAADVKTVLDSADMATVRSNAGLEISVDVQAYDADLNTWAGITPSTDVQTVLGSGDMATLRQNAGLEIGVNIPAYVQGYSATITIPSSGETNVFYFNSGILTNWVQNP